MPLIDPATSQPLPDSAIQRVLFSHQPVHIYGIPPLTSTSGFSASSWTSPTQPTAQHIFTARLRILETSVANRIKSDIVLEDPNSGDLFAAAPYTSPAVVQQANDSSRFFAVRVVGEGGMKATLGIGFEDRSPAFDFGVALGEARKILGWDAQQGGGNPRDGAGRTAQLQKKMEMDAKRDFSLKEGEKIVVNVPGVGRRKGSSSNAAEGSDAAALFSIAPPPPAAGAPPSSLHMQHQEPSPERMTEGKTAQELGFDDGEFGEFQ